MNRRRFLKYAGATAAVLGGSALGLNYMSSQSSVVGPSASATVTSELATVTLSSASFTTSSSTMVLDPFLAEISSVNREFAEWLSRENPYYYRLTKDGIDDYARAVIVGAAELGDLAPYLVRMPEIYSKEVSREEITKYLDLVKDVDSRDRGAAQFVLETGLFMEDRAISELEQRFVTESLDRPDLLRVYVSRWVLDGIQSDDVRSLKQFEPALSGPLGYLTDDFGDLPEVKEGKHAENDGALEQLESIVQRAESDYQVRKGVCLIDEYGIPDQSSFLYRIPGHNTQLQVLLWLAQRTVIPPEYYRVALACGLVYGSLVTIGDSQVRTAIADYVAKVFDFIVNTDRITSGHGENRRTTGYPLEADMMLAYFGTEQLQPFVDRDLPSYGWSRIYRNNPMRLGDFKWYFFEPAMMKEVREYMLTEGPLGEDARSDVIYAESAREYPYLYDAGTDREATNLDNYMVWGQDPSMIRLWETLGQEFMTIDGEKARTWNIENMNWEWEHFKQEGTFVGACTDNGYVSSELLRSTGIPAVCGDMRFVYGDGETIHSFPAYYNSHQQVLKTNPYQFIGEMLRYYEGRDVSPEEAHRTPLQTMVFGCQKMPWENFKLVDEYVALPFQVDYRRSYLLASARDPIIFGLGVPVGYILRADKLY